MCLCNYCSSLTGWFTSYCSVESVVVDKQLNNPSLLLPKGSVLFISPKVSCSWSLRLNRFLTHIVDSLPDMNSNNFPRVEAVEIDLIDEFDFDESNDEHMNTEAVAVEFNDLITEFDNAEIAEDITVLTSVPTTATAVYMPSVIPVAETIMTDVHSYNFDDGDEMLVEAIEIISCEPNYQNNVYTSDEIEREGSQFVEYSTDPFECKQSLSDVQSLHNKMDLFMNDNSMVGSNEYMEEDDILVFAAMMQSLEQEHMDQTCDQVENKHIMQAMIISNQQHVQEVNAYHQQQDDIAVQIGPICIAPFGSEFPQFSIGCTSGSTSSQGGATSKKKCSKKKKQGGKKGFGVECHDADAEEEEEYDDGQKNVLRQEATAKRKRTGGKFAKRTIEWVSITEAMQNNNTNSNEDDDSDALKQDNSKSS